MTALRYSRFYGRTAGHAPHPSPHRFRRAPPQPRRGEAPCTPFAHLRGGEGECLRSRPRPGRPREAVTVGIRLHHRADARTGCTAPRRAEVVAERGGIDADSGGAHGPPFDHKTGNTGERSWRSLRTSQMTHGIKRAAKGVYVP